MKHLLILLPLCCCFLSLGQQQLALKEVDQNKILKEIAYTSASSDELTILYWFPEIYWDIMSTKDPKGIPPEVVTNLKQIIGNKSLFFAISGKLNPVTRQFDSKSESYMRNNVSINYNGTSYKPIPDTKLTEEMKMLNDYLKPLFGRMLGELGSGVTIFYFEITDKAGNNALDAYSNRDFTYSLASVKTTFHLPLPSLYTDSKCSNDGELFPANYEYCPYHGSKLVTQQPPIETK